MAINKNEPSEGDSISINYDSHVINFSFDENTYSHKVLERTERFLELDVLEDARRYITKDSLVVDVGAHIGNHTLFFAKICECKVVAIEPDTGNFGSLQKSVTANGISSSVTLFNGALNEKLGVGVIADTQNTSHSKRTVEYSESGDLQIMTLDILLEDFSAVDVIKIDVEGAELEILKGGL